VALETFATITPIFLLIGLGCFAHNRGFIPSEFLGPANRLIFYFAIPAMVFRAISRASLRDDFHGGVLLATLFAATLAYGCVWLFCRLLRIPPQRAGGMIQSAGHGNLGYIGLPFAFYFLGEAGLIKAGIISGFLMILQNILSISALQSFSSKNHHGYGGQGSLLGNPVIISSLAGIAVSGLGFTLPQIAQRTLDMLGDLAPPMALLLIGASISFKSMREHLRTVIVCVFTKLFLLPAVGLALYVMFGWPASDYLPGLILLACPTATMAYVMARELGGDPDFAVAAISASTLFSAVSFLFWLELAT
jgi:hypothetical protein